MSFDADIVSWAVAALLLVVAAILLAMLVAITRLPRRRRAVALRSRPAAAERILAQVRDAGEQSEPGSTVFENTRAPMLWLSLHGRVVRANDSAASLLGYAARELVGTAYEDLLDEDRSEAQSAPTAGAPTALPAGHASRPRELRYRRKDGGRVDAIESAVNIENAQGQHRVILVTLEDITLRKRAEETIGLQSVLLNSLRQAIVATDLKGTILYWSQAAETLFGLSRHDVLGMKLTKLAPPVVGRKPVEEMINEVSGGRSWSGDFPVQRSDRTFVSTSVTATPMRAPDGTIVGIVAVSEDLAGEGDTSRALHEERRTLELLNRTAGVLSANLDLKVLLQVIMDAGIELTDAGFGALFFRDGEHYELVALGGAERHQLAHAVGSVRLDALPFVSDSILRSDDIATDRICQLAASAIQAVGSKLEVVSFLAVPLISRSGDVNGGLFFTDPHAGRFSARLEKLMDGIASHASIAIENARLFHGARQEIETRRKTEQSLHESEARFRDFAQVASDVLWETDVNHRIVSVVGDTIRAIGAPSAEIIGKTRWEFCRADVSEPEWRDHIQTTLDRRPYQGFEFQIPDADGGFRWISSNGRPIYDGAGRFIGYRGTSTNITAKKAAERRAARNALQQQAVAAISQLALQDISSEQFFETAAIIIARAVSVQFVGIFRLSKDRTSLCLEGSRGWPPEQEKESAFPLQSFPRLQAALRRPAVLAIPASDLSFIPARNDTGAYWAVAIGDRADPHGVLIVGEPEGDPLDIADDDFLQALAFVLATALDRRRAEAVLQLRDRALESLDRGIVITDSTRIERPIIYVNPAFEEMTGIPADRALGRNIDLIFDRAADEASLGGIHAALDKDQSYRGTVQASRQDGSTFTCDLAISPILGAGGSVANAVCVLSDLTERQQLEAQLRQAQKMQAVGHLTGGVAHDFNNLLAVILGNAEILFEETTDPDLKTVAELVMTTAERGAELTKQLLAFGRRHALRTEAIDIGDAIESLSGMLRRTLGEQISLVTGSGEEPCRGLVDRALFESAILNLAVNARDAMPQGGTLKISTRLSRLSRESLPAELSAGDYILIEVRDSGAGMSRDVMEKVFEPFFTTKEVGKGSGLGLPMVYGFAKQSGGHVAIASEPKKGTTVTLYLPEAAADSQVASATKAGVGPSPRGAERILLVEDEPEVRRFVSRQLTGLGYAVVEAGDGTTALTILGSDNDIDLLFSDIVLPGGMSGFQLLRKARDMRPALRAVLTTGFAQDFGTEGTEIVDPILRKPYKRQELAETLREALTRQAA